MLTTPTPAQFTLFEAAFKSSQTYDNPFWEVDLKIELTAPSGQIHTVDAFWDGDNVWRMRFSPDETGRWQLRSECSNPHNSGLHGQLGQFDCVPYRGDNPLYRHGPLTVAPNGRYLCYADGTPFFWLGDTAWNGGLRAQPADWQHYLRARRRQGFNAIQLVMTQWRGAPTDGQGEVGFEGTGQITVNPSFFRRLDTKIEAINAAQLMAVPVMLWTLTESDPGQILAEADAIRLARYQVARWGAYQLVWFLGGDGRYQQDPDRWRRIGRAVFGHNSRRLVTLHPSGQNWIGELFRSEPWFDFIGYQSGHGDSAEHLTWLTSGPPATHWANDPPLPVINLEPNYELHPAYHSQETLSDRAVRRASYWSLLASPPAGVTFGHNSIWVWPETDEVPAGHEKIGPVPPWFEGFETAGVRSLTVLQQIFGQLEWWRLRPAPQLLVSQPGQADPTRFVAAALTDDGATALLYLPAGGRLRLHIGDLPAEAHWINPRTGETIPAGPVSQPEHSFSAPNDLDWLLQFRTPQEAL